VTLSVAAMSGCVRELVSMPLDSLNDAQTTGLFLAVNLTGTEDSWKEHGCYLTLKKQSDTSAGYKLKVETGLAENYSRPD